MVWRLINAPLVSMAVLMVSPRCRRLRIWVGTNGAPQFWPSSFPRFAVSAFDATSSTPWAAINEDVEQTKGLELHSLQADEGDFDAFESA